MNHVCEDVKCLHADQPRRGWYCAVQKKEPDQLPCNMCRTDQTKKYMARYVVMASYDLPDLPEPGDLMWSLVEREVKLARSVLQHRYLMSVHLMLAMSEGKG